MTAGDLIAVPASILSSLPAMEGGGPLTAPASGVRPAQDTRFRERLEFDDGHFDPVSCVSVRSRGSS
jgi:hypothetical protein